MGPSQIQAGHGGKHKHSYHITFCYLEKQLVMESVMNFAIFNKKHLNGNRAEEKSGLLN
jgi:hypothetical protein